jgi:SAM-dependent methyltransferase
MSSEKPQPVDAWASGAAYEPYVGRWSRLVAQEVLAWLAVPPAHGWLDAGCGTGALSETILTLAAPSAVTGIDASAGYVAYARKRIQDPRIRFQVGDLHALPFEMSAFDVIVSGLVLNFVPDKQRAVMEMARVVRPGGVIAGYVWDYAGEMQFMRHFWDAAVALDPAAGELDEGLRFPICQPEPLAALFHSAGLQAVEVRALDVPTVFRSFDDFWSPFLGGQGPAPSYTMSLNEEARAQLRERLHATLPRSADGSICLSARAWAVRGVT